MSVKAENPAESAAPDTAIATIVIVTNSLIQAKKSDEVKWIDSTAVTTKFITTLRDLLDLPDGARVLVLDYRPGWQGDVCETAKLMIRRGNFEEYQA